MDARARLLDAALDAERLANARRINLFRLLGLLLALGVELAFRVSGVVWIGAPLPLLVGWTAAATALVAAGTRSERAARAGSLAVAFLDMPLLVVVISHIMESLRAAGFADDAARVSGFAAIYVVGLLVLTSLALDRRRLLAATLIAAACELTLLWSRSWDLGLAVLAAGTITLIGAILAYATGRTARLVALVADGQRQRERLERYFSPQVVEQLTTDADLGAGGQTREVTVLFCDLRDFTPLAEAMRAGDVVDLLNAFFERMVETVFAHGGTLDKYLGDGLMAYFGAPVAQEEHALRALRCAVAMRTALGDLNAERARGGGAPLRIAVGVHTGTVVLGDIGAARRRDYTIVGDAVNVAARLQELAKSEGVDVLVSETTRERAGGAVAFSDPRPREIRGRVAPLLVSVPVT